VRLIRSRYRLTSTPSQAKTTNLPIACRTEDDACPRNVAAGT
jgi:hypothetical protein